MPPREDLCGVAASVVEEDTGGDGAADVDEADTRGLVVTRAAPGFWLAIVPKDAVGPALKSPTPTPIADAATAADATMRACLRSGLRVATKSRRSWAGGCHVRASTDCVGEFALSSGCPESAANCARSSEASGRAAGSFSSAASTSGSNDAVIAPTSGLLCKIR